MIRILLFCLTFGLSFALQSAEFTIGINEREVFRYKNADGAWAGKDIELIEAAFRRTPHTYKLVSMPWARVLKLLESGAIDLTIGAAKLPERQVYAWFSEAPFRYSYYTLFARKDRVVLFDNASSLADIAKSAAMVGALRGAIYSETYYKLSSNPLFTEHIAFIDDDQSLPELALKGRVDGYIESEIEGIYYLNQNEAYRDFIQPLFRVTLESESQSFMMFSKKSVLLEQVKEFDAALQEMHSSGEYDTITAKYQALYP
ncbi:Putative amino acid ABC transporter, periplasmic amino acid-binding protein [Pseudoalteromonas luteoviolacea B = ATCC 29581]|nr:Putative amino acid ABC transporter, periplasmic amino acid-binding protein [Pseudoalteromonas luteoviolacea B = ATCC 29581]